MPLRAGTPLPDPAKSTHTYESVITLHHRMAMQKLQPDGKDLEGRPIGTTIIPTRDCLLVDAGELAGYLQVLEDRRIDGRLSIHVMDSESNRR